MRRALAAAVAALALLHPAHATARPSGAACGSRWCGCGEWRYSNEGGKGSWR